MEKETEIVIEEGKEREIAESLKTALQNERDEKKALKAKIAELESAQKEIVKAPEVAPKEEVKEPEKVDVTALVKEEVKKESFSQDVSRNIVALASDNAEAEQMRKFLSDFKGEEKDAVRLAKMAKAAVNADSFIGDVGAMASQTGMLSVKSGGTRPATSETDVEVTETQYAHMRALGYKTKEDMKKALKALAEYENRK
jgi:hypothetical protein